MRASSSVTCAISWPAWPTSRSTRRPRSSPKRDRSIAEAVGEFRDGWLADESPLGGHDVDRVMRFGYQQAIELAAGFDPPAPIESHWVTGAGDDFELHIVADPHLVTVLIFIPADRDYGSTPRHVEELRDSRGRSRHRRRRGAAAALDDGARPGGPDPGERAVRVDRDAKSVE